MTRRDDSGDAAPAAWLAAVTACNTALDAAYPVGFWDQVARPRDPAGLDRAIDVLEADS